MNTKEMMKEVLIKILNNALIAGGIHDVKVIDLSADYKWAQTIIGERKLKGVVRAEIICPI